MSAECNLSAREVLQCPLNALRTYGTVGDEVLSVLSGELLDHNKEAEMCRTPACGLTVAGLTRVIQQNIDPGQLRSSPCVATLDESSEQ